MSKDEIQGSLHCPFDFAQDPVEMTCFIFRTDREISVAALLPLHWAR
jgi:hypothetical protein